MVGHLKIEFQSGEAEAADQPAHQKSRHHGGDDQEEQVIGGDDGAEGDERHGEDIEDAAAGNLIANPA